MEEYLLVAACVQRNHHLRPDVAEKLLSLEGAVTDPARESPPPVLEQILDELKSFRVEDVAARNEVFFQEGAEKLKRRSEDRNVGLGREIEQLDKEIAALRREGRQSRGPEEQLAMQKRLRVIEDRRKEKRRQYYDEQDHIDADKKAFVERMEAQLRDKHVDLQDLFTIRWTLH